MRKYTKTLDWEDIEGLTIEKAEPLNPDETDVKIIFTNGLEVFISGGNCGGYDCMYIEKEVEFLEIPDYGDLFTMDEFLEHCKSGLIMNDDGSGYFALEDKWTRDLRVYPNTFPTTPIRPLYTHIIWFNK